MNGILVKRKYSKNKNWKKSKKYGKIVKKKFTMFPSYFVYNSAF